MGRVRATAKDHPGSSGGYSGQYTFYDQMGRLIRQTNPTEMNGSWLPVGDDAYNSQAGWGAWRWSYQSYDWKGRPLVTTNTDGTTKQISYSGCGCAGGEVETVIDEGTVIDGTLVRRSQRTTRDILGRVLKAEALNPDMSTYSMTVNTYNARDQIVAILQQDPATGSTQETVMTYDGHGRLATQRTPKMQQNRVTSYSYNQDDTLQSTTDARGATRSLSYNNRGLVTETTYSAGSGTPPATAVGYSYDAAGNRTRMTDGEGYVDYEYDMLSKLKSETRQFNGLNRSHKLSYTYNLAGQLTAITDPYGAQISYAYDHVGRMLSVNGSGFADVSQYATGIQYRAWDAVKALSYGNNKTLAMAYNERMQVSSYLVPGVLSKQYVYEPNGILRYSSDVLNPKFDRSYKYNHVGKLVQAFSGAEARGEAATNNRPYNETFQYNVWGDLTNRTVKFWTRTINVEPSTYVNNRNTAWQYDADGNLINSGDVQYVYDAAGQIGRVLSTDSDITQSFDGDGRRVKRVHNITIHDEGNPTTLSTTTTYYLRSSVLGGKVVTEFDAQAQKNVGYVYMGESILALQRQYFTSSWVLWEHRDASNASLRLTTSSGAISAEESAELDPLGTNAELQAPVIRPHASGGVNRDKGSSYPNAGDSFGSQTTQCFWDGIEAPCTAVATVLSCGLVGLDPDKPNPAAGTFVPGIGVISSETPDRWEPNPDDTIPTIAPNVGTLHGYIPVTVTFGFGFTPNVPTGPVEPIAPGQPEDKTYPGGDPNPIAQLGPCPELIVPEFESINKAASTLLKNTFGDDAKAFYNKLSTYDKAVLLNTAAAAASVGVNFSKATFDGFLFSDKTGFTGKTFLPYGFYVKGISGVTSGRHRDYGSVEIEADKEGRHIDVDLYNPTGGGWNPIKRGELFNDHQGEISFNGKHNRPTHPGDVARQLQRDKKVDSGVKCKT